MFRKHLLSVLFIFFCPILLASPSGHSVQIAKVLTLNGEVLYRDAGSFYWEEVHPDTIFTDYDEIETDQGAFCEIKFIEGHVIRVEPKSKLILRGRQKGSRKGMLKQMKISVGKVWIKLVKGTDEQELLLIETPFVSVSQRDTLFSVSAPAGKVSAYRGNLEVMSGRRKMVIAEGFESEVKEDGTLQVSQPLSAESIESFAEFAKKSTLRSGHLDHLLSQLRNRKYVATGKVISENFETEPPKAFFRQLLDHLGFSRITSQRRRGDSIP